MSSINPMSPMSPIIKVCGMRQAENIRAVEEQARPDLMGFIFWEHSPAMSVRCRLICQAASASECS